MAIPKANTLQQKMGFVDQDLNKPKHDEIMMWLNGVAVDELSLWIGIKNQFEPKIDENIAWLASSDSYYFYREEEIRQKINEGHDYLYYSIPTRSKLTIIEKIWEKPVLGNNKFIIGFIDLSVKYKHDVLAIRMPKEKDGLLKWHVTTEREEVYFEAKTEIPSLGELIRQINTYRNYVNGRFIVVCPDDRCKDLLAEQGIGFVKYNPTK